MAVSARKLLTACAVTSLLAVASSGCGGGGGDAPVSGESTIPRPKPAEPAQPDSALSILSQAARSLPLLGQSITQSINTTGDGFTTDIVEAVIDHGRLTVTVEQQDGTYFEVSGSADAPDALPASPIRAGHTAHQWSPATRLPDGSTISARINGEIKTDIYPLRSVFVSGNWGTNPLTVDEWEASGRRNPLIPLDYVDYLKSLHVNWVGLHVGLHYDDSMDSTVERVYSKDVDVPTFTDDALRQYIREFRKHGFEVYLTLGLEAWEAVSAERPINRFQLGDPGLPDTGVPGDDPNVYGQILPENWPWRPDHPDHERFVAEFWRTYTDQAVHFAKIAEAEGARLFSLGGETDRLFRTRPGGAFANDFGTELKSMVADVRKVFSGLLTYDMHYSVLQDPDYFGPGSGFGNLWKDLGLDVVGVSSWFPLTESVPTTATGVEELEDAYERIFRQYLIPLANRNPGKRVLFTEFGAHDTVEAPANPGHADPGEAELFIFSDANNNGLDDGRETQANIFQAMFNTVEKYPGVVNGAFLWDNWVASEELWEEYWAHRRYWPIRGKAAAEVVRETYESWGTWLVSGYWLHLSDAGEVIEAGSFVDGPELDGIATLPPNGSATYEGVAAGGYAARYGTDFSDEGVTAGTRESGEFEGPLEMTADFEQRRITGSIHSLEVAGARTLPNSGSSQSVRGQWPYELLLGDTDFDEYGFTGATTVTSKDSSIGISSSGGSWGGKFSTASDGDGNPRLVAGTHGAEISTTGGTQVSLIGTFVGATNR